MSDAKCPETMPIDEFLRASTRAISLKGKVEKNSYSIGNVVPLRPKKVSRPQRKGAK